MDEMTRIRTNSTILHFSLKVVVRLNLHPLSPADQLTRETPLIKGKVIQKKAQLCLLPHRERWKD
jgi:hypothetical protein